MHSDIRGASTGNGEFRLSEQYEEFGVSKTQWVKMSDEQREQDFQRFL